ncbi:phosphatidylglycerol lysyltransferase domain-containing protein [Lacibacterium aquatile]|uniref:Phosphatidylglycerol lysyltransferase n=1 Tax=Lacibacterium aquatile TaxID=1168082 RepID=A0ABW5DPB6_9PROT
MQGTTDDKQKSSAEAVGELLPAAQPARRRRFSWRTGVALATTLAVLALVFVAMQRSSGEFSPDHILTAIEAIPTLWIIGSIGLTGVSFGALLLYDLLALRHLGQCLPLGRVAPISFVAYAVGNAAGSGPLTGGLIRLRYYPRLGLSMLDVAQVTGLAAGGFAVGLVMVAGLGLVISAGVLAAPLGLAVEILRGIGLAILAGVGLLSFLSSFRQEPLKIGRVRIRLPGPDLLMRQSLAALLDIAAAAAALWILLDTSSLNFIDFLTVFAVATALGVLSQVPAGLGVFETVMVAYVAPTGDIGPVLSALVLYRFIYHGLPLLLSIPTLAALEAGGWGKLGGYLRPWLQPMSSLPAAGVLLGAAWMGGMRGPMTLAATALAWAGLRQLLRMRPRRLARTAKLASYADLQKAEAILGQTSDAYAGLVRMGDKSVMFSDDERAVLMYRRSGSHWIALFDPVGPRDALPGLIWKFLETVKAAGGIPCFYEAGPEFLDVYADAGLRALKLGERARVNLQGFSIAGQKRANLRHSISRAPREGISFQFLTADSLEARREELQAVSNGWLNSNQAKEKSFSLGAFEWGFVRQQRVAVVEHNGRIVAFATAMHSGQGDEVALDLMRVLDDAPRATMDYLMTSMALQLQAEGVGCFNLGMAPLSGLSSSPAAPVIQRLGSFIYRNGGKFYNFQGLRTFKTKFGPSWQPRYLVIGCNRSAAFALIRVAVLIAGSVRGVFAR